MVFNNIEPEGSHHIVFVPSTRQVHKSLGLLGDWLTPYASSVLQLSRFPPPSEGIATRYIPLRSFFLVGEFVKVTSDSQYQSIPLALSSGVDLWKELKPLLQLLREPS